MYPQAWGKCGESQDTINAKGTEIVVLSVGTPDDFISLTDIARYKNTEYPSEVIQNWMRNRSTVEFLGLWERLYNPDFNYLEFEVIDSEAGRNGFVLTPKRWIESVNATGMTSKQGRYAATFAHKDIAFKFASWISAEFELYIIKDYQRLKSDENYRLSLDWNVNRVLAKVNYKIHTNAIRDNLIPPELTARQRSFVYADEADILNVALFGHYRPPQNGARRTPARAVICATMPRLNNCLYWQTSKILMRCT
jgi:hypothetical protein